MQENLSYQVNNNDPGERKRFIRRMFDSIVPTYDLLNRLLSMGIDTRWRKAVIRKAGDLRSTAVLDTCCGTGDLSKLFRKAGAALVSLDFSVPMLVKGRSQGWLGPEVVAADASNLPFKAGTFRFCTIAFGIRNIPDIDMFVRESARVLEPGGKLIILELTRPENPVVAFFYRFYLGTLLPVIGGIVSGKKEAYRYLSETISTFIDPPELAALLKRNGFPEVEREKKAFGIATIYVCGKPGI
ncbi:MAG: ubiquinone/menaquinone biosynthesis methyltransferase [bacterium]|nr:ubiquinone/menaquinone biosynthesis methyltransferase [bacterium]